MSYHAASLTPSRPAPQAPQRRADTGTTYGSNSTLAALGYSSSFNLTPASPGSSYTFPYSGIGGTPARGQDLATDSQVVRLGWVSMKDDSFGFGNWIFQRKWLVLKEASLSIHKNEVSHRTCMLNSSVQCTFSRRCPKMSSYLQT
jgi:protein-serine/threonine kinase